jgi:hypothetical protein
LILTSALLSACSSGIETASSPSAGRGAPQAPPPVSATCAADQAQFAVGQRRSDDLLERSRTAARASVARYLRPDQPITMEFLATRLNLNLDGNDVVVSVRCG